RSAGVVVAVLVDGGRKTTGCARVQLHPAVVDGRGGLVVEAHAEVLAGRRNLPVHVVGRAAATRSDAVSLGGIDGRATGQRIVDRAGGDTTKAGRGRRRPI